MAGSAVPSRSSASSSTDLARYEIHDTFVEWFEDGRLPLNDLVTTRFAIDEVNEAVNALTAGRIAGRAIFEF